MSSAHTATKTKEEKREVLATLRNYRQSPRKVRLVADMARGKNVARALADLKFSPKRGSEPVEKLIRSAMANAKDRFGAEPMDLVVSRITVDGGLVMKRSRPSARGRAKPIHKKSSHITVILNTQNTDTK